MCNLFVTSCVALYDHVCMLFCTMFLCPVILMANMFLTSNFPYSKLFYVTGEHWEMYVDQREEYKRMWGSDGNTSCTYENTDIMPETN